MPPLSLLLILLSLSTHTQTHAQPQPPSSLLVPTDAVALISFKGKADLDNKLLYTLHERFDYCLWQGVKCQQGRVVRFSLPSYGLRGVFPSDTLSALDQLRVLDLRNNSLSGPIPDLSSLSNLRSLLLDRNFFSGGFPPSILSLYKLRALDFSYNNLSGPIPVDVNKLDRIVIFRVQFNHFNGSLPPFNQSMLQKFNVSGNEFVGEIPNTPVLNQFPASSFALNPNLCGEVVNKHCNDSRFPFFDSSSTTDQPASKSPAFLSPPKSRNQRKKRALALGFSLGGVFLASSLLCLILAMNKRQRQNAEVGAAAIAGEESPAASLVPAPEVMRFTLDSRSNELKEKSRETVGVGMREIEKSKSGNLVFCDGEVELYTLEQLMKASAEMLGRGTMGTTYKAKLDNQLIVTVKRLDAMKMAGVGGEMFERHMENVGALRHPNLVPIRAYFQARDERLIIFDYQPNGSIFNLIHGSRSTRAKPLHWTSCLKIAEDVAQGLAYIHQASKLAHGNLKASNVLLGTDFEACLTDYCLATLASSSDDEDPDSARYRGPEARKSGRKTTRKSDVYSFGVLLLELLSGKPPPQHPFLSPPDMPDWVRAMRGNEDALEDNQLGMLVEVASLCSLTSPEQRPTMWHVLKMIQRIKATVSPDDAGD